MPATTAFFELRRELLAWGEADFDQFVRFVGSRLPFPLSNGVGGGLGEDGVAALYVERFDGPIWRHKRIDFDDSCEGHSAGQCRVWSGRVVYWFALGR